MIKQRKRIPAFLMVAAASLASVMFTSYAFAQCLECDEYPNRDPFTQGLVTTPPANQPGTSSARNSYDSRAEMRSHRSHHSRNPDHAVHHEPR
jgi:hypothetical protein